MLNIKELNVSVEEKQIIKDLSLKVGSGEVHAIMGPNGSGKSTIAHTLAGNPNYEVTSGKIDFNNEDLLNMDPSERSLSRPLPCISIPNRTSRSDKRFIFETNR